MRNRVRIVLLCTLSVLLPMVGFLTPYARDANANGKPIKIVLTYLPGLSNWGPTEATGLAEVVMKEGEVGIGVVGLPPLSDEVYSGWMVNTRTDDLMRVGEFNADKSEVAKVRVLLPSEIPDTGWNLFLVTVESGGQGAKTPGPRKSVAGYFPEPVEVKNAPSQLPKTGGDTDPTALRSNPPYSPPKTVSPRGKGFSLVNLIDNGPLTYGVVVLAAFAVGVFSRGRIRRK